MDNFKSGKETIKFIGAARLLGIPPSLAAAIIDWVGDDIPIEHQASCYIRLLETLSFVGSHEDILKGDYEKKKQ